MSLPLYSFESLWRAYRECRRNKRATFNALAFEVDAEAKLLALAQELRTHTYRPGRSICFITAGLKPREVFAADFRDRIVHHLLVGRLEPVFEPRFIHDSYACRPGKGTLAASNRLMQFLRRITCNGRRPAWSLKLDVASFFTSIHKQTLYAVIARHVRDPELLWLTHTVLFHDPTHDYRFQSVDASAPGPKTVGYPVPRRKSLFGKDNECGLPIGNLTSQFWANVYLNELDQFVKRTLRCRHYVRYVDDLVLLSNDADELLRWRGQIEQFLEVRLRLTLRAERQEPMPVGRGVDFVGWKTWWNYRVARRQTLSRMRSRVRAFEQQKVQRAFGGLGKRIALTDRRDGGAGGDFERLRQTLASYSGHLRHGAAWGAWRGLWEDHLWLGLIFRRQGWVFAPRWPERQLRRRFRDRYAALLRGAGTDCLVFHRFGRFVEFYGPQRLLAERVLGLRRVYLPRAGYGFLAGFPVRLAGRFGERALERGLAVVTAALVDGRAHILAIAWPASAGPHLG
jgi:RNA-directed DNA polymerase